MLLNTSLVTHIKGMTYRPSKKGIVLKTAANQLARGHPGLKFKKILNTEFVTIHKKRKIWSSTRIITMIFTVQQLHGTSWRLN